jgi:L-seryl-tRNA(Ser) seleniumtransferase
MDLTTYGLQPEPVVADRLRSGADVVTLSGDKLLGGPQCGVVVGKRALVESIRRNPLKRALRCDKSTLAALEETLRIYRFDPAPERSLPVLAQLVRPVEALEALGTEALTLLAAALGEAVRITLEKTEARVGSGSQPEVAIESRAVALRSTVESADELAARFRGADPPIIGRIEREVFYLDLRAVERASDLLPSGLRPAAARTRA